MNSVGPLLKSLKSRCKSASQAQVFEMMFDQWSLWKQWVTARDCNRNVSSWLCSWICNSLVWWDSKETINLTADHDNREKKESPSCSYPLEFVGRKGTEGLNGWEALRIRLFDFVFFTLPDAMNVMLLYIFWFDVRHHGIIWHSWSGIAFWLGLGTPVPVGNRFFLLWQVLIAGDRTKANTSVFASGRAQEKFKKSSVTCVCLYLSLACVHR